MKEEEKSKNHRTACVRDVGGKNELMNKDEWE